MPTQTLQTFPQRTVLEATRPDFTVRVPATAASGFAVNQGDIIGIITSSGKVRRRSRTTATGTGGTNASAAIQVTDASVFVAGDVLTGEDGVAIGTVQSVNTVASPNTVTLSGNSAINIASGDSLLASDGSQVAAGISDDASDGTNDTTIAVTITGLLDSTKLRGLDSSAQKELEGAVVVNEIFKF